MIATYDSGVPLVELGNLLTAYCVLLKERIRGNEDDSKIHHLVSLEQLNKIRGFQNKPIATVSLISQWIPIHCKWFMQNSSMLRMLEMQICDLTSYAMSIERIVHSPIPFSYVAHAHHLLAAYLVTLPFCLYSEFGWYSIVVVALLSFGLLGIEEAGMEIEDPFSPATGSLEELCKAARKNTEFICGVSTPAVLTEPPISGV